MVKARFNFKQNNEDELSFSKGEVILVTRQEEGGWWEGSLYGKMGWFPSNYVREIKPCGELGLTVRIINAGAVSIQNNLLHSFDNLRIHLTPYNERCSNDVVILVCGGAVAVFCFRRKAVMKIDRQITK